MKVDTVNRVALAPYTLATSRKDVRHSGDRVDRISNKVDRVCNTADRVGNEIQRIGDSRLCADLSPVSEIVDFVAVRTGL